MSTNIYAYEEKVSFNPTCPNIYYGWYISTSSSELKVAHFTREARRAEMVAKIKELYPEVPEADHEILAACSLIMSIGDGDNDSDFARDMALDHLTEVNSEDGDEKWASLRAIGDDFATHYE